MRRLLVAVAVAASLASLFAGCGKKEGPKPGDVAAQSAKGYYDYLLHNKPEAWVEGFYRRYPIPDSYKQQLVDNARMYIGQQQEEHKGIKSISVRGGQFYPRDSTAIALLNLHFANGDSQQVAVPMVFVHGVWYMK